MSLKYILIAWVLTVIITAAITQFYFPKIQTKIVDNTKEVTHTDVQTVIKTVTQPNGQIESTTTIIDHTQRIDTEYKSTIDFKAKDWLVSGSYSTSIHTLEPIYGIQVNRRILGPLYISGSANSKGEVGVGVGLEF